MSAPGPVQERPDELRLVHTERSMLSLLRARHAAKNSGNGPEWAYMEHVRNAAGFKATRTADAMALGLWPSRGHELHGFEVKVSRGDWRRELAEPDKAEGWCQVVDRWWIVAPAGVVPKEELPVGWGLLETTDRGGKTSLRVTVQAELLRSKRERPPITRDLLVPMLRAAGAGLTLTPEQGALNKAREEGREAGRQEVLREHELDRRSVDTLKERANRAEHNLREIQQALDASGAWRLWGDGRAQEVARAIRLALGQQEAMDRARRDVERSIEQLENSAAYLRRHMLGGSDGRT
jgi:hypothetical protein